MKKHKLLLPLSLVIFTTLIMVITTSFGRGFSIAIQSLVIEIYNDSTPFAHAIALGHVTNISVAALIPVVAHYVRFKYMVISTTLLIVASMVVFTPSFVSSGWLYVVCFLITIGIASSQILGTSLLNVALTDERRTTYLSVINMFINVCLAATPLLVKWLGYGQGSYLYTVFALVLFSAVLAFSFSKAPKKLDSIVDAETSPNNSKETFWEKSTYGLKLIKSESVLLAIIILCAINFGTLGSMLVIWGQTYNNISLTEAAYIPVVFAFGGVFLSIPLGYFADRIGLIQAMIALLICLCGCYAFLSFDDYIFFGDYICLFLAGGCTVSLVSISTAYIGDTFKGVKKVTAVTSGSMLINGLVGIVTFYALSESIDQWGAHGANFILLALNIAGVGILLYLNHRAAKKHALESPAN